MSESLQHVCRRDDLQPGEMKAFEVGRSRIVLCRTPDSFAALRDICSHHGARLSGGLLGGTNLPCGAGTYKYGKVGEVIRCPRHGYEFDIRTGRSLHDPERERVKTYPVVERGDEIFIEIDAS